MKNVIFIEGNRNGYGIEQCGYTMTVGELIEELQQYNENTPVYLRNDKGYTYGSINYEDISEVEVKEDVE